MDSFIKIGLIFTQMEMGLKKIQKVHTESESIN